MALTPSVRISQARALGVGGGDSGGVRISQARVFAIANFPTDAIRISQGRLLSVVGSAPDVRVSQARVLAVVRGRIENRRLRAWTFSLDGHDFYVLRLGERATIVCDLTTGQWSDWTDHDRDCWRAQVGMNWLGMGVETFDKGYDTNIVCGDDTYSRLFIIEPTQGFDEPPFDSREPVPFQRIVRGGITQRMRQTATCNAVYVTLALGIPAASGASITLRTSDDLGKTWADHGAITVNANEWDQEVSWRSLGLVRAPGRMFELSDNGATVRIAGMDMR